MDVTPHDLRNAELREAFRGYRPDEVEELLERAAVTLERMHERNRLLQERLAQVEQEASGGKEMESVLRQTLLLAQRTADETVTTAHERARQLLEEAEDRALTLTTEAEQQARSAGEAQRRKYETIVAELSTRREFLTVDINALERVQVDYRSRLRAMLQNELEDLERRPELPAPVRPELHEIDLGAVEDAAAPVASKETKNGTAAPAGGTPGDSDGGPPTEALVIIDEEMAESGPPGAASRRRR
jgi:cell division initiation protein